MPTKLKQLMIDRIDLVDQGANQDAKILLYKRDAVTKNDDYSIQPMTTQEVLDYQSQSEVWHKLRAAFMESMYSIEDGAALEEKGPLLLASIEEFADAARAAFAQMDMGIMLRKRCDGGLVALAKAGRVIAGKRLTALKQAVQSLQKIVEEAEPKPTQKGVVMAEKTDKTLEDVTKRAETAEGQVATLQAQAVTLKKRATDAEAEVVTLTPVDIWKGVSPELRQRIEKAEQEVVKRDCIGQVQLYKGLPVNPDDHWEMVRDLNTLLPEQTRKQVYALLSAGDEAMTQAVINKRSGHSGSEGNGGSAYAKMKTHAQELVSKGQAKTFEQALVTVMEQHPDLYAQSRAEERGA